MGSRRLVDRLATELGLNTSVPYGAWFQGKQVTARYLSWFRIAQFNWAFPRLSQVAGWTQVYGGILSFATIRGASHEAPFSQPQRSLLLFKSFLDNRPPPQVFWCRLNVKETIKHSWQWKTTSHLQFTTFSNSDSSTYNVNNVLNQLILGKTYRPKSHKVKRFISQMPC